MGKKSNNTASIVVFSTVGGLLLIGFIVMIAVLLSSCSADSLGENNAFFPNVTQTEIEMAIDEAWKASIPEDQPEFLNQFDQRASYSVKNIIEEGDGYYTVELDVTSPDISAALIEYKIDLDSGVFGDNVSDEDMNQNLCELIDSAAMKTTQQTIFAIVDSDGNINITFTQDFVNAMFGYAYNEATEEVAEMLQ